MTAQIIDGRALAAAIRAEMADAIASFRRELGYAPTLAVVRVGNDPASVSYAKQIDKTCGALGIGFQLHVLPRDSTHDAVVALLEGLGRDEKVHGVMLQRPVLANIDADEVMSHFPVSKDVEGVTPINIGRLTLNEGHYFPTSTPSAAMEIFRRLDIPLQGKHAVVVGRSNILGRPMALLLLHAHATVTICHSRTRELAAHTRGADLLIAAAGQPKLITRELVKPGAVVIDFGVNYVDGAMCGDVDFESVREVASLITPVPGGTGPITTMMLMRNTLEAARRQTKE